MQCAFRSSLLGKFLLFTGITGTLSAICAGQQPPAYLVRIPVPIVGNTDERVKREVEELLAQANQSQKRPILVLEFWPPEDVSQGATSQFERSLALASYLASERLNRIRTVAYLPRTVVGHAVLPVIACEEIIMHPTAKLGDAGRSEATPRATVRGAYREVANRRRTIPEAVALAMLDKQLKVWRLETPDGKRFVLDQDLPQVQQEMAIDEMHTLVEAGAVGLFSAIQLRQECALVNHLAEDRRDLSQILGVPVQDLEPDPSRGGSWRAIQVEVKGIITPTSVARVQKIIEDAIRTENPNLLCMVINSPGGSPEASLRLASFLAQLDASEMRTIAYVTREARSDAAILAWVADHLVIEQDAILGGPGAHEPSADEIRDVQVALRQLARLKSTQWSVPAAMLDPQLAVGKYGLVGTDVVAYFTVDELAEQPDPARWNQVGDLSPAGEVLKLDAETAEQLGIARYSVEGFQEFKQLYHIEDDPRLIKPNWAHNLIEELSAPHVAAALLFLGCAALIAELSSPGIGIGGFVASVCFILFFWSQFLSGTATWLEVLLFVSGLAFIAIEVFVLPGFGIFGVGGMVMVIGSIVLASQTFVLPRNAYQAEQFPQSLLITMAGAAGIAISLIVLSRFLDRTPWLRHMMLNPPTPTQAGTQPVHEPFADLLYQRGVATTLLMPSGKAKIGKTIVDVVTDGMAIEAGTPLEVIEVIGNRIVVQPIETDSQYG